MWKYPRHGSSIYRHDKRQQDELDRLVPTRSGRSHKAEENDVQGLCEGKETYLGNELVAPAHDIAQKREEECCRQHPLLLIHGTQGEPSKGKDHPDWKGHGHEIQHRKNDIDEDDIHNEFIVFCSSSRKRAA